MAQLVIRNLEDEVKERLLRRAVRSGRSMEEEVCDILRKAVKDEARDSASGLGTEIAALFAGIGLDAEIPELRGHVIEPAMFVKRSSAKRTRSRR